MTFGVFKYHAPLECFAIWRGGFTPDEVDQIAYLEKLNHFSKGVTGSSQSPNKEVRDSDIAWLFPDENTTWVFAKMGGIISKVNYDHFLYNIEGIESFQFTKYREDGHYTWHFDQDMGWQNYVRKISVVMMLSDPSEYEGGEFEICTNGNLDDIKTVKPDKGDIIFFASWMPHRVKPVTSGERKSLVTWVMGKREC